jgi:hypothetical protein
VRAGRLAFRVFSLGNNYILWSSNGIGFCGTMIRVIISVWQWSPHPRKDGYLDVQPSSTATMINYEGSQDHPYTLTSCDH